MDKADVRLHVLPLWDSVIVIFPFLDRDVPNVCARVCVCVWGGGGVWA